MSTPTRELQNLSVGGTMPNTRSQASQDIQNRRQRDRERQQRHRAGLRSLRSAGEAPSRSTEARSAPPTNHATSRNTGVVYDMQRLSPHSQSRVIWGLQSDKFMLDHSMRKESERGLYYAFQLKKPESIRIFDPASDNRRVTCTCEDFEHSSICVHVYWLYDALNAVLSDTPRPAGVVVTNNDVMDGITELFGKIGRRLDPLTNGLESLTKELNRRQGEGDSSDADDSSSDTSSQGDNFDTTESMIQDMLSSIDPKILPDEYGEDFKDDIPAVFETPQSLIVPGNLEATIFGLARHDKTLRRRLRKALDKTYCANVFLEKLANRMRSTLATLDNYGPHTRPGFVDLCGDDLRELVTQMQRYTDEKSPLSDSVRRQSAEIAVNLLRSVCARNIDIYDQITGPTRTADPEEAEHRNLFVNLICGRSEDNEGPEFFVLDFLTDLPAKAWKHLLEPLDRVLEMLKANHAPQEYLDKLDSFLEAYRAEHDDASRVTTRRPYISGQQEGQRRRVR